MPVMDGFKAARELRARGNTTPAIALTAHAMQEERERAKEAGFDDYLTKPIHRGSLYEALEKWARPERSPDEPSLA